MSEAVVFLAFLLGGIVQSSAGFGSALVSMPILTLVLDPRVATPLQNIVGLGLSLLIFYQHHERWPWRDAFTLIVFSVLGVPIGTYALLHLSEPVVLGVLGAILLLFAVFELVRWDDNAAANTTVRRDPWGLGGALAGFLAGILGAAYATNGPPAIIYGQLRRWPKSEFKSALQSMFIVNGICILLWQSGAGLLTAPVGWNALFAIPGLCIGAAIGYRVDKRLDHDQFRRLVLGLLVVLGVFLVARAWY